VRWSRRHRPHSPQAEAFPLAAMLYIVQYIVQNSVHPDQKKKNLAHDVMATGSVDD
jgi:hypothetical protein